MIDPTPDITKRELNQLRTLRLAHKTAEVTRMLAPARASKTKANKTHRPNRPVWIDGMFFPSDQKLERFLGRDYTRPQPVAEPKVFRVRGVR
jgi:hypothetical protein